MYALVTVYFTSLIVSAASGLMFTELLASPQRAPHAQPLALALVLTASLTLMGLVFSIGNIALTMVFLVPFLAWAAVVIFILRALRA